MIRLHILVEGQTEETMVRDVLSPYLSNYNIFADAICVETSHRFTRIQGRELKKTFRGGLMNYEKAKRDLVRWIKQESKSDVYFTTMFDLYRLPNNFPGYEESLGKDIYERIHIIENRFKEDIAHPREQFIPYIQLFEFEALLLSNPKKFSYLYPNENSAIRELEKVTNNFNTPEHIDDDAPPSKRIKSIFQEYDKVSDGPVLLELIGIDIIREKCAHFNSWIEKIESLKNITI